MTNLEPCPFCPEGVLPVRLKKDGKPTGIVAHDCRTLDREIRVPEHVWQTRYKRTCKREWETDYDGRLCLKCSECHVPIDDTDAFCSNCGAEVVNAD